MSSWPGLIILENVPTAIEENVYPLLVEFSQMALEQAGRMEDNVT